MVRLLGSIGDSAAAVVDFVFMLVSRCLRLILL